MSTEQTSVLSESSAQGDLNIPSELQQQILQLFNNDLSEHSIKLMKDNLQMLHRSSFHLEFHYAEPVWARVDPQRLLGAVNLAHTQVLLLLTLMDMLYEEIICSRQDLQAFMMRCDQGTADAHLVIATEKTLIQLLEYLRDFNIRPEVNLQGPLEIDNELIPNHGNTPVPQIMVSVTKTPPVVFDRVQSHAKSTTVLLVWGFPDGYIQEPNPQFEILVKTLHPSVAEQGEYNKYIFHSYCCRLEHLIPDYTYEFTVKRPDAITVVYSVWMDTLQLRTSAV